MNKKLVLGLATVFSVLTGVAAPTMYPYTLPATHATRDQALGCLKADEIVKAGGKLELGKWYTDFTTCKKYCDDNGIPLLAIWGNAGCVHCWYCECCFTTDAFMEWAAANDAGKVIYCFMAGGEKGAPDQTGSEAYNWMWKGGGTKLDSYPFVVLWWQKKGLNYRATGDGFCKNPDGTTPSNFFADAGVPTRTQNIIYKMTTMLGDWHPEPEVTYAGGYFTQTNYPYASLQAEATTKSVAVEMVRDSLLATNQTLTIAAPGKKTQTLTVTWAEAETAKTQVIANFDTTWFVKDGTVTLTLFDGDEAASTVEIACVAPANSASNPKWIGKSFEFGEWTMDLAAAKQKVAQKAGEAYTLVSIQGSQWCPDCANVERNFLDLEDKGGNRFAAWARSKNVALVSIDIPNFKGTSVTDHASPCLLSRTAYKSTLARSGEYPQSGADSSLTNAMWRSGLGYLTRNGVSDADAAAVLARNHELVSKNTYEGGFHRPEDGNAYRTGVPIFVLLRKDGSVAARLTRMAAVSPMASDKANFDNYIKRFEEMMAIADNNATEIENNYPSASNQLTLKANGGSETATISHTDTMDVFRLDGVGGNALQSIMVTGTCTDDVVVSLVTTNAAGRAETLVTSGKKPLSEGVGLEYTFERAGSYFVKVEVWDIKSTSFRLESPDSTFQEYTVKGAVVLVPQEDKATARAPENSDRVTIKLTEGEVYYITGMAACAALQPVSGAPAGFYVASEGGNVEMTLTEVDGEVSYQVWNSGEVGFVEPSRTVQESVCDMDGKPLDIKVLREGGKSGWAKMTVSVDTGATTLLDSRYWLVDTNSVGEVELTWADGETGEKTVQLYIDDTLSKGLYDGTTKVTLKATCTSQAGDVEVASGKGRYELTVREDDKQMPGTAFFYDAEPSFARPSTVFVRESDGAKIWAKRVNGSDGLVAALLVSSVKGTIFTTEDPRDAESLEDVLPGMSDLSPLLKDAKFLYWSSRETKAKYVQVTGIPAGKTAKVYFRPVANLKGVSASNTVTIVSVQDSAPGFARATDTAQFIRYVSGNPLEFNVENLVAEGVVSFRKIAGTLPAGVKVGFVRTGDTTGVMTLSGTTTAKPGTYEATFQVSEKRGGETVNGLVTRLTVTVLDPIMTGVPGVPEPVAAVRTTRTFKDVPVMNENGTRLMGLLQVTIPPTGRVSAKVSGIDGTVNFSSKAWSGYSPSETGWELQAALASNKDADTMMGLVVYSDGSFGANLKFKKGGEDVTYVAMCDGRLWSKDNPADAYAGYYTAALKHKEVLSEDVPGVAPTGHGYMTLKMNTKAAASKGMFTVAGRLPNGTTFSGSAVLWVSPDDAKAYLPLFKASTKDVLSVLAGVEPNAKAEENRRCVKSPDLCDGYWKHTERTGLNGSYEVAFQVCGSYYDAAEFCCCCAEYYETTNLLFYFDDMAHAGVIVEDNAVRIDTDQPNLLLVTLNFNRATGVITGTSKHPSLGARISYAGVIVNGWGEGCGCGPGEGPFLPFMSGSYFYKDGRLTMGGLATIDK